MALLLTTPEQHDFEDPTLELDEKRLKKWLASLPVLNAGDSLRRVLDALEPLNEQRLDADKRLRLMAIYQATVKRLYDSAEPLRLRQQPLSQQQRQATVDNVERLCLATANGFKIAIKEIHAAGVQSRDSERFGRVLRWAVQQLAAALLHSYRFYRPEPPFVFLELNQLYRLARHHGVQDNTGAAQDGNASNSLAAIYQAICLLSLTDPFSAGEGQVDRYFRSLLQFVPGTRIVPGNSWQGTPEGLFYIDLQSDCRPRHCVLLESPVAGDDPHILDARIPLQRMHRTLAALSADRRGKRIETSLLRALLPEVAPRDRRRSERRSAGHWIEVVVGLEAVCDYMTRCQRGEQAQATRWRVQDSSEQGYRLAWGESAASVLQVGDLVCVVADSEEQKRTFRLLVVRWVCDERDKGTELGVEKLAGMPNPVRVEVSGESGSRQALFLSSTGARDSAARLVTPPEMYSENRSLLLHVGERAVPVCCTVRVEQGPGFDCFEFTSAR
ncbi:MAG: hypothetical protein ACE5FQ_05840 [Thiogranum sp.]